MLRSAVSQGTELGLRAKAIMDRGDLVSDDVILGLVRERLQQDDCRSGFLFDGFPRTIAQAQGLVEFDVHVDAVVEIQLDDEEIVNRVTGRRVHEKSGRVYHQTFNPPKVEGFDDETGEPLRQRDDDTEPVVRDRLMVYNELTAPLIAYYREKAPGYFEISGTGNVDEIRNLIANALDSLDVEN